MLHSPLATSCVHPSEPVDGRGWLCLGHLPGLTFLSFSLAILQCSYLCPVSFWLLPLPLPDSLAPWVYPDTGNLVLLLLLLLCKD